MPNLLLKNKTMHWLLAFCLSAFAFNTALSSPSPFTTAGDTKDYKITVAPDGTGDYTSISAALLKAKTIDTSQAVVIIIQSGTYREKVMLDRPNVMLRGVQKPRWGGQWTDEGVAKIVFSQAREMFRCDHPDDWGAATLNIRTHDVWLENLVVVNDFGFLAKGDSTFTCKGEAKTTRRDGHQFALRCMPPTQRLTVRNCNFHALGGDTVSPWDVENGTFHFADCTMEGGVDFYCPRGWAYAERCYFICHNRNAAIWHDGTGNQLAKTVLKDCYFMGEQGFKLGRFHREAQFYLVNCRFSSEMADADIYQVPANNLVWGKRVHYYNCHRDLGDYAWHANSLDKKTARRINRKWTLAARWNLPVQPTVYKSDYSVPKH